MKCIWVKCTTGMLAKLPKSKFCYCPFRNALQIGCSSALHVQPVLFVLNTMGLYQCLKKIKSQKEGLIWWWDWHCETMLQTLKGHFSLDHLAAICFAPAICCNFPALMLSYFTFQAAIKVCGLLHHICLEYCCKQDTIYQPETRCYSHTLSGRAELCSAFVSLTEEIFFWGGGLAIPHTAAKSWWHL